MRNIDNCPPDDVAAKLEPIQKMELENEVLVTGEGGKITTITQVEEHHHHQHTLSPSNPGPKSERSTSPCCLGPDILSTSPCPPGPTGAIPVPGSH